MTYLMGQFQELIVRDAFDFDIHFQPEPFHPIRFPNVHLGVDNCVFHQVFLTLLSSNQLQSTQEASYVQP